MRRNANPERRAWRLRLPDLSTLSPLEFGTVVLALVAGAAWMVASGLESHADLRQRLRWGELRNAATSPVAYRKPVPATRQALLAGTGADTPLLVLRADSLPDPAARERLCALARDRAALASPGLAARWVALTADVPDCARPALAATPALEGATLAAVHAEIRSARWVLTDEQGRILHNARNVPTAAEARSVVALASLGALGGLARGEARP